jgi:hypothetical protein
MKPLQSKGLVLLKRIQTFSSLPIVILLGAFFPATNAGGNLSGKSSCPALTIGASKEIAFCA